MKHASRTWTRTLAVVGSAAALTLGTVACETDDTTNGGEVEAPDPDAGDDGADLEEGEPDPGVEEDVDDELDDAGDGTDDGMDDDTDDAADDA